MRGFRRDSQNFGITDGSGCVVIKATTPPQTAASWGDSTNYWRPPGHIYVPDSSLSAYRNETSGQWPKLSGLIYPISQMTDEEVAMGTIEDKYAWME